MRYRIILSVISILYCNFALAQNVFFEFGKSYREQGNYAEAIICEYKGIDLHKELYGEENIEIPRALGRIADCYYCLGDLNQAIEICKEGLVLEGKVEGTQSLYYSTFLHNLSYYYYDAGAYEESIKYGNQALKIREALLTVHHPYYIITQINLAGAYSKAKKHSDAIRFGLEALENYKNSSEFNISEYLSIIHNMAGIFSEVKEYKSAINIYPKNLESYYYDGKISYGELINALYYKGLYCQLNRDYVEAINIYTTLLDLNKQKSVYNRTELDAMEKMVYCKNSIGLYSEAIEIAQNLSVYLYSDLRNNPQDYFHWVNILAFCYMDAGDYPQSKEILQDLLKLYSQLDEKNESLLIDPLINLAQNYRYLGNYPEARETCLRAIDIYRTTGDTDVEKLLTALNNLANYYAYESNIEEAIQIGSKVLAIKEEMMGPESKEYINSLVNLAQYDYFLGNYKEAINKVNDAKLLIEKNHKEDKIMYAQIMENLAGLYMDSHEYEDLLNIQHQVLSLKQQTIGINHPDYMLSLLNLSNYLSHFNKSKELGIVSNQLSCLKKETIQKTFKSLPIKERNYYWEDDGKYWFLYSLQKYSFLHNTTDLFIEGYNALIFSKSILLNSEIEFDKFLTETGSPELVEKYNDIRALRIQLNKLYEQPIAERKVDTDSLERVANNVERELMRESKEFGDYTRNLSVTWQDVQKGLQDKEAAIEFVSFPLNPDSIMYMAYVLKPETEAPEMVKLFEESQLEPYQNPGNYADPQAAELIWGRLEPYLEGCETVYFAPDGLLHQIGIEYFPDLDGEGLISDRYNIHRLSSTRQLALRKDAASPKKAAVYGGILYGADVEEMEEESRKYPGIHRSAPPMYNLGDSLNLRDGVKFLPQTAAEANVVNSALKKNKYKTIHRAGKEATEESFKSLSGSDNGIIHIATHGFYWSEEEAEKRARNNERFRFMTDLGKDRPRYVEDKALSRTGLMMAGANHILTGDSLPTGLDDGLLTATEIAQMNLRNTDLVVLSACQTGMGDLGSDGVFGLQRGFKKAGVNTLLMSLWKVEDDATRLLMEEFYQNLMGGQSKREALLNAQKAVREYPGDDKDKLYPYAHPSFWAAFILLDALN